VGAFDGPLFQAIVDATDRGIPVISMSLGSYAIRSIRGDNAAWLAWNRVAQYANRGGTLVVASAGNEALNLQGQLTHVPSDVPTILSTAATGWSALAVQGGQYVPAPGSYDVLAFYSNIGSEVDLTAPGGDCGPDPDACLSPYFILNAGIRETNPGAGSVVYYFMAGTSMATPHVSAVAAMVRALHPELTPGEVRSFLKETAEPLGDRHAFGHGMIDADAATR
ncbi:MAG TPA: S8 family serine peptidase, partial [Anaeromyxobacteraceae bacterium]|nr:S8 family serine peptidase [Anaeromyxobacteraceae bacterium]